MRISRSQVLTTLLASVIALAAFSSSWSMIVVHASPQPATFYFHKQSSKTIDNVTTTLWSNSTQLWSASAQTESRAGIHSGVPAVWDFYTQPVIAGNVTLAGTLTFTVYLVSSAATAGGTVITGALTQITSTGTPIPLATASLTNPIGTTITAYTFSIASNTYVLTAGSILHFTVTVSIPNSTNRTLTLYYDTATYRSNVNLSFNSRLGILSFLSYNQTGNQISSYSRNWTLAGRAVGLRMVVFDALGLYDIGLASTTITSPSGSTYISNTPLVRTLGTSGNYSGTWALNVTYSPNDPSGIYTSTLTVLDNSGASLTAQSQFTLYALWALTLLTVSSDPVPIGVQGVGATVFVGSTPVFSGTSDSTGTVVPPNVILRDDTTYSISSFWQGLLVNQTSSYVPKSTTALQLRLSVHRVDFSQVFRNGNDAPLSQQITSLQIMAPNGTTISPSPSQSYLLPDGAYVVTQAIVRGANVVGSPNPTFNPRTGAFTIDLQTYQMTLIATDQNNQPLGNAQVNLQLSGTTIYTGTTAANGTLVIQDLPKGQYLVTVTSPSGHSASSTLSLNQDTTGTIQVGAVTPLVQPNNDWIGQTMGWILLAAAIVSGLVGYREYTHHFRPAFKNEPFDNYLNNLIPGGIRDGESTLIYGADGAGKTTVCEQLAYKSLLDGCPTVFLTYERSQAVRESMKSYHWDTSVYENQRLFQLVDCEVQAPGANLGILEDFYDVAALNLSIASALDMATTRPRVFVDSITDLALKSNSTSVIGMVQDTRDRVRKMQGEFFLTVEKNISRSLFARLVDNCDNVIELDRGVENGQSYTDFMVRKAHGSQLDGPRSRLVVVPDKGLAFQIGKGERKSPGTAEGRFRKLVDRAKNTV